MKKVIIALSSILLLLVGCGGNQLDLDEEKVSSVVADRALQQKVIKEGDYKEQDIDVVKVCEAIKEGKVDYEFQGEYIIYWETKDGNYQRTFLMKDYEISHGDVNYEPTDSCITLK
jgi:uncharacterized protein YcfL